MLGNCCSILFKLKDRYILINYYFNNLFFKNNYLIES